MNTSRLRPIPLLAVIGMMSMMLSGCAPVYVPNAVHAPLLQEQGDVQIGAYLGSSGFDLQTSVAVTNHVGLLADFSYADQEGSGPDNSDDFHHHRFGEVGAGYFTDLGRAGHFEVYGGYGRGWAEAADEYDIFGPNLVTATGRYSRLFLQPALAADVGQLRLGVSPRLVRVNFHEFETSRTTVTDVRSVMFIEPAALLQFGSETFRVAVQVGVSTPLTDGENVAFDYQPAWVALGLRINPSAMGQ